MHASEKKQIKPFLFFSMYAMYTMDINVQLFSIVALH